MITIGIIGGSGLDDPELLEHGEERIVETPYGPPSSALTCGTIRGVQVALLARHGKDHSIYPSRVNFRANIRALESCGCTHILATTAVGSLREEIVPGHLVFPGQFIDFTRRREVTFFDESEVVHTSMAEPFCENLIRELSRCCNSLNLPHHQGKTVITIEGPRFSSRAESHMFRSWGADVINMSTVPEVVLAREKKIHYAAIGMSTDYDCWHEDEEPVTWEMITTTMARNADNVLKLLLAVIPGIREYQDVCNT